MSSTSWCATSELPDEPIHNPIVTIGDTVQLNPINGKSPIGIVNFVGNINGKEGVFFGLSLKGDHAGENDGDVNGVRYFQCPPGKGLFVKAESIKRRLNFVVSDPKYRVCVGDTVALKKLGCCGVVRFIGCVFPDSRRWRWLSCFAPSYVGDSGEITVGIELEEAKGQRHARLHGRRLFDADRNCALFLRESQLPIEIEALETSQEARLSLSHSTESQPRSNVITFKNLLDIPSFDDYCVRYDHVHDETQDDLDNIDVGECKEMDKFTADHLLNLFDKVNVTDEDLKNWTDYSSVASAKTGLRTVTDYTETNSECPIHIKTKLRMVTKILLDKPSSEHKEVLLLISSHGNRCNVMKNVAVNNAYGALTNSLKEEMHKQTLAFQVRKALRNLRLLLVEKLFHSLGQTNNTHNIAGFHNKIASEIGVRPYVDVHQSSIRPELQINLDKRYFATYTKEVIVAHIEKQIEEHKVGYQKIVDFLIERCPQHIDNVEFLESAIDVDTGKISSECLYWILAEIGVLEIKPAGWKPIEKCW